MVNKKYVILGSALGTLAIVGGALCATKLLCKKKDTDIMNETENFFFTQECVLKEKKRYQRKGYITYVAKYGINLKNLPYLKVYPKNKIDSCEVIAFVGENYSEEFLNSFISNLNEKKISFLATTPEAFKSIKSFITTVVKENLYPDVNINLEKYKK